MTEKLTRRQGAILSAATGILCGPFTDFHGLAEELLGRPVWTHEMGDEEIARQIREAARPLLVEIAATEDDGEASRRLIRYMLDKGESDESIIRQVVLVHGEISRRRATALLQEIKDERDRGQEDRRS